MKHKILCIFSLYLSVLLLSSMMTVPPSAIAAAEKLRNLRSLQNDEGAQQSSATAHVPHIARDLEFSLHDSIVWAVLWLDIPEGYYTYAHEMSSQNTRNQQSANIPITLRVTHENSSPLPIYYPPAVLRRDFYDKDKIIHAYEGKVPFFIPLEHISATSSIKTYTMQLRLLLCSQKHCVPITQNISFTSPTPSTVAHNAELEFHKTAAQRLHILPEKQISFDTDAHTIQGTLENNAIDNAAFKKFLQDLKPRSFDLELEVSSITKALFLGILAGLVLNFMPCVLPVLSMKASAFLVGKSENNIMLFREHMLYFAAGILTQFSVLAILLASAGLMWGEFFQNIVFLASMLVLVFVLALSSFGAFTLPIIDLKAGQSASPRVQAFFTGMFTTLLATPCSGPLLGGVLSWAFLQPMYILLCVFMAVGLGMSAPYLFLAYKPQFSKFLPKPGAWMHVLERLVAFFLLATALYLFSILPTSLHMQVLATLLLITFIGWLWGHFGGLTASPVRRRVLTTLFLCSVITLPILVSPTVQFRLEANDARTTSWMHFNPTNFEQTFGQQPILLEFTADWCPNCKFIEKTVFTASNMQYLREKYNIAFMQADITRHNAYAETFLDALGSKSIPFTAIFSVGDEKYTPLVLRDIYTKENLDEALKNALQ